MVGGDEENYAIEIRYLLSSRNTPCVPLQNIDCGTNNLDINIYFGSDAYL